MQLTELVSKFIRRRTVSTGNNESARQALTAVSGWTMDSFSKNVWI